MSGCTYKGGGEGGGKRGGRGKERREGEREEGGREGREEEEEERTHKSFHTQYSHGCKYNTEHSKSLRRGTVYGENFLNQVFREELHS